LVDVTQLPRIGAREFMGGEVLHLADDGASAAIRFDPPEGMANPHGGLQGGFTAAMIDDVVSMATYFAGGERMFVTSNLNCYYLKAVPMGVPLNVSCQLLQTGKRQAIFDAQVCAEGDGEVLVRATQIQQFIA